MCRTKRNHSPTPSLASDRPPNELRIAVIQGMDLLPMDLSLLSRHGGTSDPYVVVKCKKEKRKTSIKKETLMPMWREVLTIPVSDRVRRGTLVASYRDHKYDARDHAHAHTRTLSPRTLMWKSR